MDEETRPWVAVAAAVCFVAAFVVAAVAVLMAAGLVREYGPAEGYGNLTLQTMPIVAVGLIVAALLTWAGLRLRRRRSYRDR